MANKLTFGLLFGSSVDLSVCSELGGSRLSSREKTRDFVGKRHFLDDRKWPKV